MKGSKRSIWVVGLLVLTLFLVSLVSAAGSGRAQSGSTYGRGPDGYGAWYAMMEQRQGVSIQRWQKPLEQWLTKGSGDRRTLLQVSSSSNALLPSNSLRSWVGNGNTLVLLGVKAPVTSAPFRQVINHPAGKVLIETRRRATEVDGLLEDSAGAVVWQESIGSGKIIYASTPHLAANAYQAQEGNFELLAQVVTESGAPIWVDEYLHGYKDRETIKQELGKENLFSYLAKTPLLLVGIQAAVMVLLAVLGQRRLGPPVELIPPPIDNSTAYITAMAQVLRQAKCSEFVVETISKAERQAIQRALGLGTVPLSNEEILAAWTQQTSRPETELRMVLNLAEKPRSLDEVKLTQWLQRLQVVHRWLPHSVRGFRP